MQLEDWVADWSTQTDVTLLFTHIQYIIYHIHLTVLIEFLAAQKMAMCLAGAHRPESMLKLTSHCGADR